MSKKRPAISISVALGLTAVLGGIAVATQQQPTSTVSSTTTQPTPKATHQPTPKVTPKTVDWEAGLRADVRGYLAKDPFVKYGCDGFTETGMTPEGYADMNIQQGAKTTDDIFTDESNDILVNVFSPDVPSSVPLRDALLVAGDAVLDYCNTL